MTFEQEIHDLFSLYFPRIISITICAIIVGIEREFKGKPAGARTMVLIGVGCCILTILSYNVSSLADPSRLISTILTGIGFIGGGVILKTEDKIIGITTAAFIWVVSAFGIMSGMGIIYTPIILTLGLVLLSLVLNYIETFVYKVRKSLNKSDAKNNTNERH